MNSKQRRKEKRYRLKVATKKRIVIVEIDSDDDFYFSVGNEEGVSMSSEIYNSIEKAIAYLKTFEVTGSYDWNQSGNTFTRRYSESPKEHWFMKHINKAIESLEKEEDYSLTSNQTLTVEILNYIGDEQ